VVHLRQGQAPNPWTVAQSLVSLFQKSILHEVGTERVEGVTHLGIKRRLRRILESP
jgi:hypothetical protein